MSDFQIFFLSISLTSLLIWIVLIFFWGDFWKCNCKLDANSQSSLIEKSSVSVCAVVPARNEAEVLPKTLRSLFQQTYPLTVILIDDQSSDGTADIAKEVAASLSIKTATISPEIVADSDTQLHILSSQPLPAGWTGKLWALEQATHYATQLSPPPDYLLLSDADIDRVPTNVESLLLKARAEHLDLVSLMVLLRCQSFWEKLIVPAFVFFFQKLYPFSWTNDPKKSTAAAAGGCILMKREALERIGGIAAIKNALIDDCSLAKAVKSSAPDAKIWLGLTESAFSLRPYDSLSTLWDMVARTAFTQLNYSPLLLLGTLLGMGLVYLVPQGAAIGGMVAGNWQIAIAGFSAWSLMSISYLPTLRLYRRSPWFALTLPFIAFLYSLMTLDSALRHWQGRGGSWKGRVYNG
ncbi:glycosyltransferase [Oscillatoria sp. FACHB-1406]|uniref:glycosyltransferase n=1 Tax=Oscillatoria sp. FACHB-1406 TaxID=2692846 RepID=UPI001684DAED|nr:glycosyltransferase [Oscillatoria sp. FACHB-1406]MBD2580042.1 glycosyltransferase [Oscillatoria sp. FACHB-1406]